MGITPLLITIISNEQRRQDLSVAPEEFAEEYRTTPFEQEKSYKMKIRYLSLAGITLANSTRIRNGKMAGILR